MNDRQNDSSAKAAFELNPTLKRIQGLLNGLGWSLYRLSKETGIPYSSLSNIFQRNNEPSLPTLRKICNGLGITLSVFFDDADFEQGTISKDDMDVFLRYTKLDETQKKRLSSYCDGLLQLSRPTEK